MAAKFSVNDKVLVETKGSKYEGIVMPTLEGQEDVLIIKLASGYNLGIKLGKDVSVKNIGKAEKGKQPSIKPPFRKNLPSISIITTGGTITSKVDYSTGGVSPLIKPEEVFLATPELLDIVNIKKIVQPFAIWSEDMTFAEWQVIAKEVAKELNDPDVSGVMVTHGTDFLHYTASALSFMLKDLNKPVAIVGGQRSSDRGSFDGGMNLICAAHYLKSNIAEVAVVMHGSTQDNFCYAIRGTNVRKMHTSRRDAFRPINELPLAKILPDGRIERMNKIINLRNDKGKVEADVKVEPKIALIKYFPGADPAILEYFMEKKYKGIIIEAAGLGHVSTNEKQKTVWTPTLKKLIKAGVFVGFTPQTIYGRIDPFVYSAGRKLNEAGVCYLGNMLSETAYTKLGWVLAHSKNLEETKKLMLTNMAGELIEQILPKAFSD
jgi:glutamyl-tRNA(Gln) amidotransferase subunit D